MYSSQCFLLILLGSMRKPFDHPWKRFDPPKVFGMFQRDEKGAFRRNELKFATHNLLKVLQNVLIHQIYWIYQVMNIDLEADCPTRKIGAFRTRSNIYDGAYHENSWQFLVISIADVWQCLKYASAKSFPVTVFSWFLLTIAVLIFKNEASMFPLAQKKQLIRKLP